MLFDLLNYDCARDSPKTRDPAMLFVILFMYQSSHRSYHRP